MRLEAVKRLETIFRKAVVFVRRDRGAAVVEFAVLLPVLLLIVFGVLDFGRAMNYKNELTQVANQVARAAAVNRYPNGDAVGPSDDYCANVKDYLTALDADGSPTNVDTKEVVDMIKSGTITVGVDGSVGAPVSIELKADFSFLSFLGSEAYGLGSASKSLKGEATMRLEQVPQFGSESC
jgi:Flp pilus assembly protein TadG